MENQETDLKRIVRKWVAIFVGAFVLVWILFLMLLWNFGVIRIPALEQNEGITTATSANASNSISVSESAITVSGSAIEKKTKNDFDRYIFLGDSRYVSMELCSKDKNDIFIAKNDMGYEYLVEQIPYIRSLSDSKTAIIVGLGVNDLKYNRLKYMEKLNALSMELDAQIFYMSVNPVNEEKEARYGYSVTNESIDAFNEAMKAGLNHKIIYIDTNQKLKEKGYVTVDGLHYNEDTSQMIYDKMKEDVNCTTVK